jgi:CheY-like chemotaxis protein
MMEEAGAGRVLVVDDDATTLQAVSDCLEEKGWVVHGASNGAVGLERVLTFRPDVVVFDFWMPVADGRELVQGIREVARARVGLVAMSGTPEVEDWCGRVGVSAFVRKPFDVDQLRAAVAKAHDEARTASSSTRLSAATTGRSDPPTSRRLRLDRAVLVVGEGDEVNVLRGILRSSAPPMQVASVQAVADALRALASIAVDAVAVCGPSALRDTALLELVVAAAGRGIPIVIEKSAHVALPQHTSVRLSIDPGPDGLARSICDVVSEKAQPAAR